MNKTLGLACSWQSSLTGHRTVNLRAFKIALAYRGLKDVHNEYCHLFWLQSRSPVLSLKLPEFLYDPNIHARNCEILRA